MTDPTTLLSKIVALLKQAETPFMRAGSVASVAYSIPRNTHDLDIVIDATQAQLEVFLQAVNRDEYYISPEAARDPGFRLPSQMGGRAWNR